MFVIRAVAVVASDSNSTVPVARAATASSTGSVPHRRCLMLGDDSRNPELADWGFPETPLGPASPAAEYQPLPPASRLERRTPQPGHHRPVWLVRQVGS